MAATDLASGRRVTVQPVPDEIVIFLLAKEFGWTPSQIKAESSKDIKAITTVLSVYNSVLNQKAQQNNKKKGPIVR